MQNCGFGYTRIFSWYWKLMSGAKFLLTSAYVFQYRDKKITWIYLDISKWWYSETVVFKDDKKGLV